MNALFAWPGGKRNLIKTILPRIPKEHGIYVEVFSGSAKLLFAKEPSRAEVINDLNGDLINFYRVAKHRAGELAEMLEHELVHPERFRELRTAAPADELGRALRFAYLTWYSYGAKGEHFAAASLAELLKGQSRRPIQTVREMLVRASERLHRVRLEQRDFADILARFDSPATFFYLDPPYVDFQDNARYESIAPERRRDLFAMLARLKGTFLMSFDNCAEVRELAAAHGMHVDEVQTRYGLGNSRESRGEVTEVLISPARERASAVVDLSAGADSDANLPSSLLSTLNSRRSWIGRMFGR